MLHDRPKIGNGGGKKKKKIEKTQPQTKSQYAMLVLQLVCISEAKEKSELYKMFYSTVEIQSSCSIRKFVFQIQPTARFLTHLLQQQVNYNASGISENEDTRTFCREQRNEHHTYQA